MMNDLFLLDFQWFWNNNVSRCNFKFESLWIFQESRLENLRVVFHKRLLNNFQFFSISCLQSVFEKRNHSCQCHLTIRLNKQIQILSLLIAYIKRIWNHFHYRSVINCTNTLFLPSKWSIVSPAATIPSSYSFFFLKKSADPFRL